MATDAFGRIRICDAYSVFEYHPNAMSTNALSQRDVDVWVSTLGGTSACDFNADGYVYLRATANGDKVTRATKSPMEYQPGKSRLIYISSVPLSRAVSGSETFTANLGLFSLDGSDDPDEGMYFQVSVASGTMTLNFVDTGATTTTVAQSSWNIDIFDGNGASGKTINDASMNAPLLLVFDQEWLGVGRVRVGFNIDGVNHYAHEFAHTNAFPYTTTPRLPLIYQFETTTLLGGSIEMRQICCVCISESGFTPIGRRVAIGSPADGINISTAETKYVALALRIQSGFPTGVLRVLKPNIFYLIGSTADLISYELQLHSDNGATNGVIGDPTLITDSGYSYTSISNSIGEYFFGTSADSGGDQAPLLGTDGYIITKGYVNNDTSAITTLAETDFTLLLTRSAITQYDVLYVVIEANASAGSNSKVAVSLDFIEST